MASQSVARSESFAVFIPELERLITEAMDEWKFPGLAIAVVGSSPGYGDEQTMAAQELGWFAGAHLRTRMVKKNLKHGKGRIRAPAL